jgi:hypothetical protein
MMVRKIRFSMFIAWEIDISHLPYESWEVRSSMAEGQILFDSIHIGRSDERGFAQCSTAFGAFALKQMASARAATQHFAGAGYLETFGYGLSGFDSLGASHRGFLS